MTMPFDQLGLNAKLLKAVTESGFTTPTPVQEKSIPAVLKGNDVMACAQTGTGKTAAFVLPALHRMMETEPKGYGKGPRVLVLTPTRELAAQVHENIQTFSKYTPVSSTMIIGGVAYAGQIQALKKRQDVVIATPGRLIDHMEAERIDFSRVEMVVLDEADRMLDMGFLKPIERIFDEIENQVQTLLFSATFDDRVEKIAAKKLKNPVRIQLAVASQNHDQITQTFYKATDTAHKQNMLRYLLNGEDVWQAIVFIATKHGADRLAKNIRKMGHKTAALHGDMRQNARKKVIDQMHRGDLKVLVATDVAARGLDVNDLSHVINYDLPMVAEDYIHRIGRTGRANKTGIAMSFVNGKDMGAFKGIERLLGKKFEQKFLKGIDPTSEEQTGSLEVAEVQSPKPANPFKKGRSDSFGHKNRPTRGFKGGDRDASPYRGRASQDDLERALLTTTRKPYGKPQAAAADGEGFKKSPRPFGKRDGSSFGNNDGFKRASKPFGNRDYGAEGRSDDSFKRSAKPFGKRDDADTRGGDFKRSSKPFGKRDDMSASGEGFKKPGKPFGKPGGTRSEGFRKSDKPFGQSAGSRSEGFKKSDRPYGKSAGGEGSSKPFGKSGSKSDRPSKPAASGGFKGASKGKPGGFGAGKPKGSSGKSAGFAAFKGRGKPGGAKQRPQRHGA
ncbi:MAG: DEAD/DEAH box helicase [Proteobacteria bacterium]|nr:DEAD/DEAH box helicase [Pseudomonadota bacterium]